MTRTPDDELVLDWWEAYDAGMSTRAIARKWDWPRSSVLLALGRRGLDVLTRSPDGEWVRGAGPAEDSTPSASDLIDEALVEDALRGDLLPAEQSIMDALGRLGGGGLSLAPRHLPFAASLPHVMGPSGRRTCQKQSAREREQDRMATGIERHIVRSLMAGMGIMGAGARGKMIGRWWS